MTVNVRVMVTADSMDDAQYAMDRAYGMDMYCSELKYNDYAQNAYSFYATSIAETKFTDCHDFSLLVGRRTSAIIEMLRQEDGKVLDSADFLYAEMNEYSSDELRVAVLRRALARAGEIGQEKNDNDRLTTDDVRSVGFPKTDV